MRPKPILSLTLLAAALAMPGIAASVGLGKLTLQSSLGQPLSAQIELTAVAPDELGSVTARIADSSLYRQNNLAYQGVLSRARVTMERLPNGDADPEGDDVGKRRRAVSRFAGRGQLGVRPRRARLHLPPRSAGNAGSPVGRSRHAAARRRAACRGPRGGSGRRAAPRAAAETRGARGQAATRSGAAIRCRASPRKPRRRASRWSRCWSRSTTATRPRSTATT